MLNPFKPLKSAIPKYTPVNEEKNIDYIKNQIKPSGGPLTIPNAPQQRPEAMNPFAFQKLKAMFAQNK